MVGIREVDEDPVMLTRHVNACGILRTHVGLGSILPSRFGVRRIRWAAFRISETGDIPQRLR